MDRKRLVLIGLAGAIVLALAAAWAVPRFTSRDNTDGVIRIAIATDETIERLATDLSTDAYAERNAAAVEQQLKSTARAPRTAPAQQAPQTPPQSQQPGETAPPPANNSSSEPAEPQASTFPSAVAAAFSQILLLQLDGQLTQGLDNSQRFEVVDTNAVETALRTMTARNNGATPRTLLSTVFRSQDGNSGEQIRQRRSSSADLASIGRELDADFFLYVGVEEPVYTAALEHDEYTGESVFVLRAQPTVAFRLFNTRLKTVELAGVIRFDEPLVAYSDLGDLDNYLVNEPGSGVQQQATPALQRLRDMPLMQDLAFQVNREIARQVIQRVLDQIAPSEIIRGGDAPIVNRGSNDGLTAGMQMDVYRMGEALRESGGRAVGAERTRVGTVEVTDDIQANVATLRVLSGGPVQRADRIELPLSLADLVFDSGDGAAASGASSARQPTALGRDAIVAAQRGEPDAIRPAIAVDSIIVRFGDIGITTPANLISRSAGNSIGDALQSDRRVEVVSRADMARLSRERRIAARASGRSGADPRRGMAVGEYFLTGEVSLDLADATRSVTYEGVSRRVGPERRNWVASGTFRVLTMDGRIEHAVEVEATRAVQQSINTDVIALIDDLSNDAVRKLLTELFPMQVLSASPNGPVRISGGTDFGITTGARLRAYTIGEPEYDPTTRVMLSAGRRTHAGDLIVTDVEPRVATARYAERPFQLNPGDVIELAPAPRRAATSRPAQATAEPQTGGATPF